MFRREFRKVPNRVADCQPEVRSFVVLADFFGGYDARHCGELSEVRRGRYRWCAAAAIYSELKLRGREKRGDHGTYEKRQENKRKVYMLYTEVAAIIQKSVSCGGVILANTGEAPFLIRV